MGPCRRKVGGRCRVGLCGRGACFNFVPLVTKRLCVVLRCIDFQSSDCATLYCFMQIIKSPAFYFFLYTKYFAIWLRRVFTKRSFLFKWFLYKSQFNKLVVTLCCALSLLELVVCWVNFRDVIFFELSNKILWLLLTWVDHFLHVIFRAPVSLMCFDNNEFSVMFCRIQVVDQYPKQSPFRA